MEREPLDRSARARALVAATTADRSGADAGLAGALRRVCRSAKQETGLAGASVHLMTEAGPEGVAASSDDRAAEFGELPFTTGEGPCLDAWRSRRPVLVPDLAARAARWPGYAAVALEAGVGGVLAFPLSVGGVGFGVLEGFDVARPRVEEETTAMMSAFARVAAEIIVDGRGVDDGSGAMELSAALDYRTEIHQAQGMVMVTLEVSLVDALARMRAHSFAVELPLLALARQVVAGTLDPRDWAP